MTECAICLSRIDRDSACALLCGHVFHVACTRQLLDSGAKTCPMCRGVFPKNPLKADGARLDRLLEQLNNG
jgi:hypothetical protein